MYSVTSLHRLSAVSEKDGAQVWAQDITDDIKSPPVLADGRVFVYTIPSATSGNAKVLSFSAATGEPMAQRIVWQQPRQSLTAGNGKIYFCWGGNILSVLDAVTLQQDFSVSFPEDGDGSDCMPAIDDRHAYIYRRSGLHVIDLTTRKLAYTLPVPADTYPFYSTEQRAPVVDRSGRVFISSYVRTPTPAA